MKISKLRVTCGDCKTVFDAEMVINAPIAVAMASVKAIRCQCGSSKVGLGGNYDDAPPLTAPVEQRAQWWKDRGEVGVSSETIWAVFAGGAYPRYGGDVPHDPDDYRRCKQLFDLLPEWRSNLSKLVDDLPWFKPFTDRWEEFERLYAKEAPKKSCPKLYDLMKLAEAESEKLRHSRKSA